MTDEFTDILTASLNIKRISDKLLDEADVQASMTADRQPARTTRLKVEVIGCTVSGGLISVNGSTHEIFSFADNGYSIGEKEFTSITGITMSGISDGFIEVKAVSRTGQPINQEISIHDNLPVNFFAISGQLRMMASGQEVISKYKFMAAPDKLLEEKDIMYAVSNIQGLTRGEITFVESIIDFDGLTFSHEAEVRPL